MLSVRSHRLGPKQPKPRRNCNWLFPSRTRSAGPGAWPDATATARSVSVQYVGSIQVERRRHLREQGLAALVLPFRHQSTKRDADVFHTIASSHLLALLEVNMKSFVASGRVIALWTKGCIARCLAGLAGLGMALGVAGCGPNPAAPSTLGANQAQAMAATPPSPISEATKSASAAITAEHVTGPISAAINAGGSDVVGPSAEGFTAVGKYGRDSRSQNPNALRLLWGFVDGSGRFITNPSYQFDQVQTFSEGFAGVAVDVQDRTSPYVFNRKWGFIGRTGRLITAGMSFPYDAVRRFSSGMAAVMTKRFNLPSPYAYTESWCFVTTQGVPLPGAACAGGFLEVRDFQGNAALVRNSAGWLYIDKTGRLSYTPPR